MPSQGVRNQHQKAVNSLKSEVQKLTEENKRQAEYLKGQTPTAPKPDAERK